MSTLSATGATVDSSGPPPTKCADKTSLTEPVVGTVLHNQDCSARWLVVGIVPGKTKNKDTILLMCVGADPHEFGSTDFGQVRTYPKSVFTGTLGVHAEETPPWA